VCGNKLVLLVDDPPANIQPFSPAVAQAFDIWGDTVNFASRLTGTTSPSAVALTEEMAARLPGAAVLSRRAVELEGKGSVPMVEVTAMSHRALV
jgi:class 3 adenylate cyclase